MNQGNLFFWDLGVNERIWKTRRTRVTSVCPKEVVLSFHVNSGHFHWILYSLMCPIKSTCGIMNLFFLHVENRDRIASESIEIIDS